MCAEQPVRLARITFQMQGRGKAKKVSIRAVATTPADAQEQFAYLVTEAVEDPSDTYALLQAGFNVPDKLAGQDCAPASVCAMLVGRTAAPARRASRRRGAPRRRHRTASPH